MFDAEKLLGTLMREVVGSSSGKKKKKSKHSNTLVDSLKSGSGLMTAIGLGIGAYEILRSKSQPQTTSYGQTAPPPPVPPAPGSQPPPVGNQASAPMPPPLPSSAPAVPGNLTSQDLACRMIQTMIAAAHADGTMDEQEEQAVLAKLKGEKISQEERMFLLTELHSPKSITELTAGISDPATAKAMYMLAVSAVDIDSEAERHWFDELAAKLGISKAVQNFIEEQ
ncbi:DUF533 domain-containing protein [Desulfopila aestuarii]|uniref:Uncharacterized protein n=1 Tax=Desulfopila aestuarii DSM 18488 TaxID=1121416 RepID=A0A1M7Y941_9BACT|nr:DUF533 domain-containing protein [Desulfopila aestuarii]SHO49076.1 Protein of unknown function [Desulfopila aestuarii DSM 18488]